MARSNNVRMAAERMRIAAAANREIKPPYGSGKLPAAVLRNFNEIVAEKPKVDWRDHELRIVVQLAKAIEYANNLQDMLMQAGGIESNELGEIRRHPAGAELNSALTSISRMRSTLGLHVSTPNPRRDAANRNRVGKQIEYQVNAGRDNKMHLLPQ